MMNFMAQTHYYGMAQSKLSFGSNFWWKIPKSFDIVINPHQLSFDEVEISMVNMANKSCINKTVK
jgi:hypothetical protein